MKAQNAILRLSTPCSSGCASCACVDPWVILHLEGS